MTFSETFLELIHGHQSFALSTHVNPDGDAVGSVLCMHRILTALGKDARIIIYSDMPEYLRFLDADNVIEKYDAEKHDSALLQSEVFIGLDFNRIDRLGRMGEVIRKSTAKKVCIDHHQHPEQAFDYYFTDTDWCATGHFLYNFITETNIVPLTLEYAEPLYAAIMTDTGSFRFERTTAEVHRIAARLLEAGVKPIEVHSSIYDRNSPGKLRLLGEMLQDIRFAGAKSDIGIIELRQEQLQRNGTREDDTEGFINMMMSIETVRMGLKFLELPFGFKVSLRSKGDVPVHLFAGQFGGGGHRNASGIRFREQQLDEMKDTIIQAAVRFLEEYDNGKII